MDQNGVHSDTEADHTEEAEKQDEQGEDDQHTKVMNRYIYIYYYVISKMKNLLVLIFLSALFFCVFFSDFLINVRHIFVMFCNIYY